MLQETQPRTLSKDQLNSENHEEILENEISDLWDILEQIWDWDFRNLRSLTEIWIIAEEFRDRDVIKEFSIDVDNLHSDFESGLPNALFKLDPYLIWLLITVFWVSWIFSVMFSILEFWQGISSGELSQQLKYALSATWTSWLLLGSKFYNIIKISSKNDSESSRYLLDLEIKNFKKQQSLFIEISQIINNKYLHLVWPELVSWVEDTVITKNLLSIHGLCARIKSKIEDIEPKYLSVD